VTGFIPYDSYRIDEAYLTVIVPHPTQDDSGHWECMLSGLNHHNLMITETATAHVNVMSQYDHGV
jgi:hypothetical protein